MAKTLANLLDTLWRWGIANPLNALIWVAGIYVGWKLVWFVIHFYAAKFNTKNLVYLRITLPREESQKDKEKQVEKDFREKIGIMEQFFRNLHELKELTLWNRIKVWFFQLNIVSFEIVAQEKLVNFYVTTYKEYQELVEKQITAYYKDADIQSEKPYEVLKKGYKTRAYYAYATRPYWFPIKTYKTIENDPLNDMTNVFSKLQEDEFAVIQLQIRPRGEKWRKKAQTMGTSMFKGSKAGGISALGKIPVLGTLMSALHAILFGYQGGGIAGSNEPGASGGDKYVRMLQTQEEIAKQIGEKSNQPGFDTVIRMFATSKTGTRSTEILKNVFLALNLFKHAGMNWFQTRRIILLNFINTGIMFHNFKNRYFKYGEKSSIMVPEELASIFHFPNSMYNYTPVINWLNYKVLPAPAIMPQTGLLLGYNAYRGEKREVYFGGEKDKDRMRHHYIIGQTGTGKSAYLSALARQDIKNGKGVCVVDPHGDLVEDILNYIPKERAKDVIYFNPSDQERPTGLNILEARNSTEMDLVSSQATEIFIKLFGDEIFGPRIQHYFRNACLTLMEDPEEGATLIDVPRIFTDEEFMKFKVAKAKNPIVRSFWEHEYANTGAREREEMIPYFSAKFGPFITNTIMRNTIGQTKSAFDFREVMDSGKILLINLSKGKIGDLNTQLLGLIVVAKIQMAAMSRADVPENERKDFFLYVDEFQNFATESFCSILSEARKYRLGLIMAHQYINQLVTSKFGQTSTQIRDAVFGNVGTLQSFKVGADDAEYLAKEYAPVLTEQDVIGIPNYKSYIRLTINNVPSRPFSLETIYTEEGKNPKVAKIIQEYSRMKYGRKREFVDQEIGLRIGYDF